MYEKKLQGVNSQLSILKCTYRVIISTVHYTQNTMNTVQDFDKNHKYYGRTGCEPNYYCYYIIITNIIDRWFMPMMQDLA